MSCRESVSLSVRLLNSRTFTAAAAEQLVCSASPRDIHPLQVMSDVGSGLCPECCSNVVVFRTEERSLPLSLREEEFLLLWQRIVFVRTAGALSAPLFPSCSKRGVSPAKCGRDAGVME